MGGDDGKTKLNFNAHPWQMGENLICKEEMDKQRRSAKSEDKDVAWKLPSEIAGNRLGSQRKPLCLSGFIQPPSGNRGFLFEFRSVPRFAIHNVLQNFNRAQNIGNFGVERGETKTHDVRSAEIANDTA